MALERFKKYCSHSALKNEDAVFLVFGFVSAQLQGFAKPAPSPKPRQKPKILAPNWLQYFLKRSGGARTRFRAPDICHIAMISIDANMGPQSNSDPSHENYSC